MPLSVAAAAMTSQGGNGKRWKPLQSRNSYVRVDWRTRLYLLAFPKPFEADELDWSQQKQCLDVPHCVLWGCCCCFCVPFIE